ncbi:MAG: class I SAM-dependent methyltransferase [Firmicutes bacterium]|nr:class I SAM-dependent methyltransferase [Bacillota bacterium]
MNTPDPYATLARHYDRLMASVPYGRWAKFIAAFAAPGAKIIDLGCGTGNLALRLSRAGFQVIGIDISPAMLSIASAKPGSGQVQWLHQSFFNFTETADLVCCTCDGLNHIIQVKDIIAVFRQVYRKLRPGGCFIFDINSPDKYRHILADNLFYLSSDTGEIIWQNHFSYPWNEADLTLFERKGDFYSRHRISIVERCYQPSSLLYWLRQTGFSVGDLKDDYTMRSPGFKTQRITFVGKKI